MGSVAPSQYVAMSIYLVKLLKRLLDFKSFLLFLIKCTAEQNTSSLKICGTRPKQQPTASSPRLTPTRAPAQTWTPAQPPTQPRLGLSTSLCGRKLITITWSEAAPPTPPPSLIVHPASTIILDNEEVLGDEDDETLADLPTDEMAFIPERREPARSFL